MERAETTVEPKEPKTFRFPRMYASFTVNSSEGYGREWTRMRIIYPNGDTEWFNGNSGECVGLPCWQKTGRSANQQVRLLKKYCRKERMDCVYVGEIR